ncbi:hypothetical protein [Rubritalea tangerina]|uniref:PEP-CTERM sorting domain-containing protein n=1 Tax=Rubritalea tangerina TaxID=430798 RepID=A0ABW4Z898_9BACT
MMLLRSLTGLLLGSACAGAAILVTPTGLTNSSGVSEFFPAANLINDSGLSGAADFSNYTSITHASAANTNAWTTTNPNGADDYFLVSSPGVTPVFEFDLGGSYALTDFVFWGYHFNAANGNEAREFFFEFSTDGGGSYTSSTTVSNSLSDFAVQNAETLNLGGTFSANTVRMTIQDNHFGGSASGGDRVGLGEVKFVAIPELSSFGLLVIGTVGVLGFRRRG